MFSLIILTICMNAFGSKIATGDLNGDAILDRAEIISTEDIINGRPNLTITLNKKNGTLQKIQAKKVLFYGPDTGLSIKKGVLNITYEGGARSQWIDIYRWRLDPSKRDFVLIGRTYEIEDSFGEMPKEKVDANYSTGKIQRTIGKKKKSCSFDSSKKIYLTTYDFVEDQTDDLVKLKEACPVKGT